MLTYREEGHQYFWNDNKVPGVNEILKEVGLIDFGMVSDQKLERACELGTNSHTATALEDINDLDFDTLSPGLLPYVQAWCDFKADYKISFGKEQIEQKLYSKTWGFAGTLDRLPILIGGKMTLVDLKTCTSMQDYFRLTTAAYTILAEENFLKMKIRQRWGVQLRPDGLYKIHVYNDPRDKQYFLSAKNIWIWKKNHNKLKEEM